MVERGERIISSSVANCGGSRERAPGGRLSSGPRRALASTRLHRAKTRKRGRETSVKRRKIGSKVGRENRRR